MIITIETFLSEQRFWKILTVGATYTACIYMFKINKGNTRTMCKMCSKLTIKTLKRRHWRRFAVFIVYFEQVSHMVLVFVLWTLNK